MTDRTERTRVRAAYQRLADHQLRTFHVPYPPEALPVRGSMPPTSAYWPGPNLPVEHREDCTGPRSESTGWHDATSGARLLVVTTCVGCGATAERRFGTP